MAEVLGFLAGSGMISLVAALVVVFLRRMGWMRRDAARLLGQSAGMACGAGMLYLAFAAVFQLAVYGAGELTLETLFHGPYMQAMLSALESPAGVGPVSLAFAWLGHLLGRALFGQPVFSGLFLAWGMTTASLFLLQARLRTITDAAAARDAAFLLLCLPGGVFFLLPGRAPLCLLCCAISFYLLGKRLHAWKPRLSPAGYGRAISLVSVLSAAVTVCMVEGRIG